MKRHLIGIGGVGMSALAVAFLRSGDEVTGADRNCSSPNVRFLRSLGIEVFADDGSGVDEKTGEVIVSTAIESSNPGLVKAQALAIPVTHRAKALARLLSGKRLVAVAGTCGKSTVTAMLGHVLSECGLDPFCVNGANVPGWEGAVRAGGGQFSVAEIDESDKSIAEFSPYAAIVTNSSADHYSKEEMDEVFDAFISRTSGPVVDARSEKISGVDTSIPGEHNRINAAVALRMAVLLGCDEQKARKALLSFGGVERRFQKVGDRVYDDYAHNPEKLTAMWKAFAELHPQGICVIWRPHGYGPLVKMMDGLAGAFSSCMRNNDALILLPVYDAGGTADRTVNSDALASLVDGNVFLARDFDEAEKWCHERKDSFGAFITCGARDPDIPAFARRLAQSVM
jgi:UDP-N-acetylmuramate--alanine ligase